MFDNQIEKIRTMVSDTVSNVKNAGRRQADIVRTSVKIRREGNLGRRFSAISRTGESILGTTPHGTFEKIGDRSK